MSDNIEPLIGRLKKDGYSALEDIVARKESEKFFVEFKTAEKGNYTGQRTLYNSDKNNFAKAISGFGNSEGGIIIWGIDASGSHDDFAKSIKPIEGVDNFKSLLESFVSLLTLPVHKTVESFVIRKSTKDSKGLVVTVIPKSDDRPHQNIGDYKYYMRAGDSFVPVPHGVLQGMFGHAPQPNVFYMFNISNKPEITEDNAMKWQVGLMAVNGGLGIGEDIYGYARAWTPGDNSQIGVELVDQDHYEYARSYGIEFSFISKLGFRLGYQQRSQMMVITFLLKPPFTKEMYVELLVGGRNQQVYRKIVQKTAKEVTDIYNRCIANPSIESIKAIWDLQDKSFETHRDEPSDAR